MKKLHVSIILFLCLAAGLSSGMLFFLEGSAVELPLSSQTIINKPTILLDDEGNEWARFELDRRDPVCLNRLPVYVIQAFIAAEDHAFFEHHGISWRGIVRSFFINLYHWKFVQGASTITQQLVKLLFFDSKKTFSRKIKEQVLAVLVERQYSKEQILETYLNYVYFGCGIYGIEAASQRFWNKSASQLTIDEAALLAAIVKSPGSYCPLLYPLSAQKRRDVVLRSMYNLNFIEKDNFIYAIDQDVCVFPSKEEQLAPHLKEYVRMLIEEVFGKRRLYMDGLIVQTTLNRSAQQAAEKVFIDQVRALRLSLNPFVDGGFISIDVKTGAIKALVGGFDFSTSKFNRVFQARRQFGSIFKAYIYAAALESGITFDHIEIDEPIVVTDNGKSWEPRNDNRKFSGQMTLAKALTRSNNIITIKTLLNTGYSSLMAMIKKLHLSVQVSAVPSLALGCIDGTVSEAAGMFNVFANHGDFVQPHLIKKIKDSYGNIVWRPQFIKEHVMSSRISGQVAKVLSLGIERAFSKKGTSLIGTDAIGKTGTTNESRTCWFAGSTPEYTTAIYLGCDDNLPLGKDIYAVSTVFPIWLKFNELITQPKKKFIFDPSLKQKYIDPITGESVALDTEGALAIFI
jgi:penicillin-binding protein 1A